MAVWHLNKWKKMWKRQFSLKCKLIFLEQLHVLNIIICLELLFLGLGVFETADIMFKLMDILGYTEKGFYVQGGDWGAMIAQIMARYNPTYVDLTIILFTHLFLHVWES